MVKLLAVLIARIFFRKIHISGRPWKKGACIWASNHPNGIVDPTLIIAATPRKLRFVAKHTLWKNPFMRFFLWMTESIPVYRRQDLPSNANSADSNNASLGEVANALEEGGDILMFPEGVSHDTPALAPLKAGIAKMALRAVEESRGKLPEVTIQPVILDYFEKDQFRSDVAIDFCEPVRVRENMLAEEIVERVSLSLESALATFNNWDEKRNWHFIFEIVRGRIPESAEEFRSFYVGHEKIFAAQPVLMGRLQTMRRMMSASNLMVSQFAWAEQHVEKRNWFALVLLQGWAHFFILLPIQIFTVCVWSVPYRLCGTLTNWMTDERDVIATLKIAHAMWLFPLWGILTAWLSTFLLHHWTSIALTHVNVTIVYFAQFIFLFIALISIESNKRFKGSWDLARMRIFSPTEFFTVLKEWQELAGGCRVLSKN